MARSLIPKAGMWLDNNLNVMLIGLHGVGKTQVVLDECKAKGLRMKYFSCSTLDPFTDLVGVPFARKDDEGNEYLKMVRPRDIDKAEIIFMDEFNRADSKVHNALMEIILFRTINGEPLPNLRMVWAAMNPPGGDYDVEELDPALLDRFDVFEDVAARPSVEYMVSRGIREGVAQALIAWWQEQNKTRRSAAEVITPRRLEKIGLLYEKTGDFKSAIPNWFTTDRGKLRQMLADVKAREVATQGGDSQTGVYRGFEYSPEYLKDNSFEVTEYLRKNPNDHETHRAVKEVISQRQGPTIVRDYGEIADALTPSVLEGLLADMAPGKFGRISSSLAELPEWRKPNVKRLIKAVNKEGEGR